MSIAATVFLVISLVAFGAAAIGYSGKPALVPSGLFFFILSILVGRVQ